jgi:Nucleotidyl transferase AbiEii toxin, Type IV TA system
MNRPTKQTPGGRAYLDLQNRACREQRPTQELLMLYVLERWLARLMASSYAESFVLKGGLLLFALDARRPTADADLLASHLANDVSTVAACVREIAIIDLTEYDGVEFLPETIAALPIRDEDAYAGVRITMDCRISTAALKLTLDVNFGDPVTPAAQTITLASQRPDFPSIKIRGYPIEIVLAEKICTAIALGEANTRVRDYADVYTLIGKHDVTFTAAGAALDATAAYRRVSLVTLSTVVGTLSTLRQSTYQAFRRRLGIDGGHLPSAFSQVVSGVVAFSDPLVSGLPEHALWLPAKQQWH